MASEQPTPRPGGIPTTIDPHEYPALAELQRHCRRNGPALIDRVYADALRMWQRLKEAEDLAGLSTPPPKNYYGQNHPNGVPTHPHVKNGEELL